MNYAKRRGLCQGEDVDDGTVDGDGKAGNSGCMQPACETVLA